ncbi:MAG: RNA recognition motif domain-containing protein [Acidobacteriota bacterium]
MISVKVFVGNLSYDTTASELESLFEEAGQVVEVILPTDRDTGRPRGFAFVEFAERAALSAAVEKFDGYQLQGRSLRVSEAEERRPRAPRFGEAGPSTYRGPRGAKPKGSRRNIRRRKRGF